MKNNVKKSLVALFCASFVVSGVGAGLAVNANADEASVTLASFKMMDGASIRYPGAEVENPTAANYGIRFSATFSAEDQALLDGYTVSAGTFIMPEYYIGQYGALTEENCFDSTTEGYWWAGKEGDEEKDATQTKILHVSANYYLDEEGEYATGLYRVNGSVDTLLDQNLDVPYVGASYLKLEKDGEVQYVFAESADDGYRSALEVAVNILGTETATEKEVGAGTYYADQYIDYKGGTVEKTFKQDIYVNSSTGYSKLETYASANIQINQPADFVTWQDQIPGVADRDGYVAVNPANIANTKLNLTGDTVLNYYFDKTDMSNVIFDSSRAAEGQNVFEANNATISGGFAKNITQSDWGWHGGNAMRVDDWGNAWGLVTFNDPVVFEPTKNISMMIKNESLSRYHSETGDEDFPVYFIVYTPTRNDFTQAFTFDWDNEGAYEITLTFKNEITQITGIEFCLDNQHYNVNAYTANDSRGVQGRKSTRSVFAIDYIHAEYGVFSSDSNLIATQANETFEFGLPISSTVYSDAELAESFASATVTAQKLASSEEATTLNAVNGKYSITVPAETNYEIKYSLNIKGQEMSGTFYAVGYNEMVLFDYEDNGKPSDNTDGKKSTAKAITGSNAWNVYKTNINWAMYTLETSIVLTKTYTTMCLWIYSSSARTTTNTTVYGVFELKTDKGWKAAKPASELTLKAGWNYVEIPFAAAVEGLTITGGEVYSPPFNGCYFDRITLK